MKKVLLACDGIQFPKAAFTCITDLNEQEPLLVTAVFFSKVNYLSVINSVYAPLTFPILELDADQKQRLSRCIADFEKACQHNGIEYRVRQESGTWNMEEMILETRFADVLIIGEQEFFFNEQELAPNAYIEQTLHRSECSVLLIPSNYTTPSRLMVTYDGKRSSMCALRQFVLLFPAWTNLETEIVFIHPEEEAIPHLNYLEEYAARHFSNLTFKSLRFANEHNFSTYATNEKGALIISGAYGRSGIAMAFRSSFVRELIEENTLPLFIAHS